MVDKIDLVIRRTFTRTNDPFGLFSLLEAAGNLDNAVAELRYDVQHGDLSNAVFLLNDAEWTIDTQGTVDNAQA